MSAPIATVFGASGGMGYSLIKELNQAGYHVRAVARNGQRMQEQFGNLPVEIPLIVRLSAGCATERSWFFTRSACPTRSGDLSRCPS